MRYGLILSKLVFFVVAVFGAAVVFSEEANHTPSQGSISSSDDCTDIDIDYEPDDRLTREEELSEMDESFFESLSKFDACQKSQSGSSSGLSDVSGEGAGGGGGLGGEATASPDISGTEAPADHGYSGSAAATGKTSSESTSTNGARGDSADTKENSIGTKENTAGTIQLGSGKLPDDIPPADNDSVLEAQIRQAAMNETDPETRKKLWDEYRKYKGLTPPRN